MACLVSHRAAFRIAAAIRRTVVGTLVRWLTPGRSMKSEPTTGRKSRGRIETKPRSGPLSISIADVNESIRQARDAFNEATRKLNLSSAQALKAHLRLRPHEQLVK